VFGALFGNSKVQIFTWNNPVQVWTVLFGTSVLESVMSSANWNNFIYEISLDFFLYHFQMSRGLSCESATVSLLSLRILFPQGAWMSVCCGCCVLSGRLPCFGLFPLPEQFYQVWCAWMLSWNLAIRRSWPTSGCCYMEKNLWLINNYFLMLQKE